MRVIHQLCEVGKKRNISKVYHELFVPEFMYEILLNTAPSIKDTFAFCKLLNNWIDCNEIFFPFLTDAGFCYSFNTLRLPEYLTNE